MGGVVAAERVAAGRHSGGHWSLDDIPWHALDHASIAQSEEFFYLVASASFMEWSTDLYTKNLIDFFANDEEVTFWLERYWLPEELQHGRSLRRYVETAWPEFDWPRVYDAFAKEFEAYCRPDGLEAKRGLEMASRCVVETGTAAYYTTLSRASPEPVLALLTRRIADDEVRHYKHFYRFFRKYREREQPGLASVVPALWRRLRMTGGEDSFVVLKHVYRAHQPGAPFSRRTYRALRRRGRSLVRRHFPYEMSIKMLLKPLGLGPRAQRIAVPVAEALARRLVP
ncbi:MAG TPA: ferritin-like domain-containing protein [Stellaceae bacterium]|nr:ferritin-like domain-containing protein [Stellaceae bacterium]